MVIQGLEQARRGVLQKSEQDRGHLNIMPDHWHYKVYQWWLDNKKPGKTPRLNFCHYWRVVLFMAAGRWVGQKLGALWKRVPFGDVIIFGGVTVAVGAVLALVVLMSIMHPIWWLYGLGAMAGIVYFLAALALARYIWLRASDQYLGDCGDIDNLSVGLRILYYLACGLPALVMDLACLILCALGLLAIYLFDGLEVHVKIGRAISVAVVTVVKTLDAHPARVPWLRLWWVLPTAGWAAVAVRELLVMSIDWRLLFTTIALTTIAFLFGIGLIFLTAWRKYKKQDYKERLAMLNTPGFIDWLWSSTKAMEFRDDVAGDFYAHTPTEYYAKELSREYIFNWLVKYLKASPIPREQFVELPLYVQHEIEPDPNRLRRTKAFFGAIWHFLVGTWALVRLLWAGLVYLKRVGACPLLHVQTTKEPTPTDTDEPVAI